MPHCFMRRRLFARRHNHYTPQAAARSGAHLPLSLVSPGQTVTLVSIQDCPRLRQRFADLGLNIGLTVRVVKNDFHGPLMLAIKNDSRLAIGRGLAHRIQVQDDDSSQPTQEF